MKKNLLLGIIVWLIVFTIYVKTSSPTLLSYADSAELMTASYTLGVPHGPGYPLYLLLGKLFSIITPGTVALRYCIFTGLFGSLAAVNTFFILLLLTNKRAISLVGALLLAFSYHFWLFSHIPEVTALNVFFYTLLTLIFLCWINFDFRFDSPLLRSFALAFGLSMTHHYTIVLLFPGFFYYFLVKNRKTHMSFKVKEIFILAIVFLLGLLPYLYLPIRAKTMPFINIGNIDSIPRFLVYLARKGSVTGLSAYYTKFTMENTLDILQFYLQAILRSFMWLGLLGLAGFYVMYKREKELCIFLVLSFLLAGPLFFVLARVPPESVELKASLERFLVPSFFIFSLGIGYGIFLLYEFASNFIRRFGTFQKAGSTLMAVLLAGMPIGLCIKNYHILDFHDFTLCETYGRDLMRSFDKDSLVFVNGDVSLFTLWYLQKVEGERPELKIINANIADYYPEQLRHHFPSLVTPYGIPVNNTYAKELMKHNYKRDKIYEVGIPGSEFPMYGLNGDPFVIQPKGLAMQVVRRFDIKEDDQDVWDSFEFKEEVPHSPAPPYFIQAIFYLYAIAYYNKAVIYSQNGFYKIAYREAEKAYRLDPSFTPARDMMLRLKSQYNI